MRMRPILLMTVIFIEDFCLSHKIFLGESENNNMEYRLKMTNVYKNKVVNILDNLNRPWNRSDTFIEYIINICVTVVFRILTKREFCGAHRLTISKHKYMSFHSAGICYNRYMTLKGKQNLSVTSQWKRQHMQGLCNTNEEDERLQQFYLCEQGLNSLAHIEK